MGLARMNGLVAEHRPDFSSVSVFGGYPCAVSEQLVQSYVVALALVLFNGFLRKITVHLLPSFSSLEERNFKWCINYSWESMLHIESQYMNSQENN